MIAPSSSIALFAACCEAIRAGHLIHRASRQDKEFHFQHWLQARMDATSYHYEAGGRNSYPDFHMVQVSEGYEVKGLAYPGRETNYDANSQVPCGYHNGRTIYYVFGRYPADPDGDSYPVLDLILCHGDFLNADRNYIHQNRNLKGFGSYGDIMIRDRKMYVAPTPFGLLAGVAHTQTLILPANVTVGEDLKQVGTLVRVEAEHIIAGYRFDLRNNVITPEYLPNPSAGREHLFYAWRLQASSSEAVTLRSRPDSHQEAEDRDED